MEVCVCALLQCIRFVSDFLKYEALDDPIQYPENLPSPYSVLCWQAGDCFDFSVVLTSMLCGVGYDAYAVMGYAPKAVTLANQELLQVTTSQPLCIGMWYGVYRSVDSAGI
jgi:hypothetical protein